MKSQHSLTDDNKQVGLDEHVDIEGLYSPDTEIGIDEPWRSLCSGDIIALLWLAHRRRQVEINFGFDKMLFIMKKFNTPFKDVSFDMLFRAELGVYKYYPVSDFETLCIRCIDFENIRQPDNPHIPDERRVSRKVFPKTYRTGSSHYNFQS